MLGTSPCTGIPRDHICRCSRTLCLSLPWQQASSYTCAFENLGKYDFIFFSLRCSSKAIAF